MHLNNSYTQPHKGVLFLYHSCTQKNRVPFQNKTPEVTTYQFVITYAVSPKSWRDFVAGDKSYQKKKPQKNQTGKVNKNEGKLT